MNLKEFFKLTKRKIIFTIVLFGFSIMVSFFLIYFEIYLLELGIPLTFYYLPIDLPLDVDLSNNVSNFSYLNFLIDIIFWHIISCSIIFVFQKRKKMLQS